RPSSRPKNHNDSSRDLQWSGRCLVRLFEHGESGTRFTQRLGDAHRNAVAYATHAALRKCDVAATYRHHRIRLDLEHKRIADIEVHHAAQGQPRLVEHGVHADPGLADFGGTMAFPDRVAAKL